MGWVGLGLDMLAKLGLISVETKKKINVFFSLYRSLYDCVCVIHYEWCYLEIQFVIN